VEFQVQFAGRWQRLHDELARLGFVPTPADVENFRWHGLMLLSGPLLLGASKVAVGLGRDRPVGILSYMLIATVVNGAFLLRQRPHRNLTGAAVLAAAKKTHARAARAPLQEEMVLAFALTGPDVLVGRHYRWALISSSSSGGDGGSSGADAEVVDAAAAADGIMRIARCCPVALPRPS
jgi:uncharacterized protein (TIGR04222 family)